MDKEPAIASIPVWDASENEAAALKLRLMMKNAEGEDKCTLCKAAEALEKSGPKNDDWFYPLILLALIPSLTGGMSNYDPKALKELFENLCKAIDEGISKGD